MVKKITYPKLSAQWFRKINIIKLHSGLDEQIQHKTTVLKRTNINIEEWLYSFYIYLRTHLVNHSAFLIQLTILPSLSLPYKHLQVDCEINSPRRTDKKVFIKIYIFAFNNYSLRYFRYNIFTNYIKYSYNTYFMLIYYINQIQWKNEKIAYFSDLIIDLHELRCSDGLPEIVHDDAPPKEALHVPTNLIFCYHWISY